MRQFGPDLIDVFSDFAAFGRTLRESDPVCLVMNPVRLFHCPRIQWVAVLLVAFALAACTADRGHRKTVVQYSTINALLAGVYDGDITFGELRRHGDFGLGTFNALDGEMIALDGHYYQIKSDGTVAPAADAMVTPFAAVTFFKSDRTLALTNALDFHGIEQRLDQFLPDKNAFYSIKIQGHFANVKARSVPRQQPPYPPMTEAVKRQSIFEFHDAQGTMVGFRVPEYAANFNVPGYHFHFLTADRHAGGHVLDCRIERGRAEIDHADQFLMILPRHGAFAETDLAKERDRDLKAVEKGTP